MEVTVSLTSGAQYFVSTGSGNHPGFAFNLAGDPTVSVTSISGPLTLSDVHLTPTGTNGPSMGTFDYFIDNPGPGASQHNDGPLVFNIFDGSGISYSDFVANSGGFYFAADIMAAGATGMSGINTPPSTPAVPEPSSIALLGTGLLAAATGIKRKIFA
jgi:PEP-CTERM motif-containing protein